MASHSACLKHGTQPVMRGEGVEVLVAMQQHVATYYACDAITVSMVYVR